MHLYLGSTSTGYKGVWKTGKAARPFEAAYGSQRLGRFETVTDAAICYAKRHELGSDAASEWLAKCEAKRLASEQSAADARHAKNATQPGLMREVDGFQLQLAPGTATGYVGVWKTGKVVRPYEAVVSGNGSTGQRLGRFETAVDAAVCYAAYLQSGPEAAREWLAKCEERRSAKERKDLDAKRALTLAECKKQGIVTECEGLQLHLAPGTVTGYTGVWRAGRGRSGYRVELEQRGSRKSLGRFENVVDAAVAYAKYIQKLEGSTSALTGRKRRRPDGEEDVTTSRAEAKARGGNLDQPGPGPIISAMVSTSAYALRHSRRN